MTKLSSTEQLHIEARQRNKKLKELNLFQGLIDTRMPEAKAIEAYASLAEYAKAGSPTAMYKLAAMHYHGCGCEPSMKHMFRYLCRAAKSLGIAAATLSYVMEVGCDFIGPSHEAARMYAQFAELRGVRRTQALAQVRAARSPVATGETKARALADRQAAVMKHVHHRRSLHDLHASRTQKRIRKSRTLGSVPKLSENLQQLFRETTYQSPKMPRRTVHPSGLDSAEMTRLRAGASSGDSEAAYRLACAYFIGQCVTQCQQSEGSRRQQRAPHLTFYWMGEAARRGHATAMYAFGMFHLLGFYTCRSVSKGQHWLSRAQEHGFVRDDETSDTQVDTDCMEVTLEQQLDCAAWLFKAPHEQQHALDEKHVSLPTEAAHTRSSTSSSHGDWRPEGSPLPAPRRVPAQGPRDMFRGHWSATVVGDSGAGAGGVKELPLDPADIRISLGKCRARRASRTPRSSGNSSAASSDASSDSSSGSSSDDSDSVTSVVERGRLCRHPLASPPPPPPPPGPRAVVHSPWRKRRRHKHTFSAPRSLPPAVVGILTGKAPTQADKSRVVAKLRVPTVSGLGQIVVKEGDDARQLARDFCRRNRMVGFEEGVARLIDMEVTKS